MPEIIKKTVHVHFSDAQRAALADQMADVQSQIDEVEKDKAKAMAGFRASLKVLGARMHEFASAVRAGEGDIVVECMWKPDANKPLEHLWRLDVMEVMETRALSGKAAEMAEAEGRQLDLVTPTPAPGGDGKAVPAGGAPGEQPPRPVPSLPRLRVGLIPPCPAPVPGAAGGICGADGDPDFYGGFCPKHHAEMPEADRLAVLETIAEARRAARLDEAAARRAKEQRIAQAAEEDAARDAAHKAVDEASGAQLDAIGGPLGCAREVEEGNGANGDTYRAKETDGAYRPRLKVAIDQAHKSATARAVTQPAPAPEVTGDGAVPPIVREKPREVTPDLIAQLAAASRGTSDGFGGDPDVLSPEAMAGAVALVEGAAHAGDAPPRVIFSHGVAIIGPDGVARDVESADDLPPGLLTNAPTVPEPGAEWSQPGADETPRAIIERIDERLADNDPAPGNEAPPPPPPDEALDGPQPLYNARREDGWPLCPHCGEDELHSASTPPREATIVSCYACGWRPPATSGTPTECPKVRRPVTSEERTSRRAHCLTCGKPINIRPAAEDGQWVATLAAHKRAEPQS